MDSNKLGNWLQIGGNFAILLGLFLVGVQLSQDRQLKRAELISTNFSDVLQSDTAELGENPMESIIRLYEQPEALTDYDLGVLNARLGIAMTMLRRGSHLERMGVWEETWRQNTGLLYGDTPLGKRWWIRSLKQDTVLIPELREALLTAAQGSEVTTENNGYLPYLRGEDYPRPE